MNIKKLGGTAVFALTLAAAIALAQGTYKVVFGGKTSSVAGINVSGNLALSSKPLAAALGASVSLDFTGKTATFTRNANTAKVAVTIQKDIAYAPVTAVVKGLGLSSSLNGMTVTITNPTPVTPSSAPSVQGASQLSGGEGVLGQTYTLFRGDSALNYQITKLEWSVGNYLYDSPSKNDYMVAPDKKALVISLTIQNPNKTERSVDGSSIRFTGVDSKNSNVSGDGYWYEQGTLRPVSLSLKPAQKVVVFTRIVVDADVSLPKLIVDDSNNAVWRYDLRGKVAPLPAPFADPSVIDGSSALTVFPAQIGVYYPAVTNFKLDKVSYSTEPWFDGSTPPEGGRWLVLYFTVKNIAKAPTGIYGGYGLISFTDQDGIESRKSDWIYRASRDANLEEIDLQSNQEVQARALIGVPSGVQPKKVRLVWHGSRTAELDISNLN